MIDPDSGIPSSFLSGRVIAHRIGFLGPRHWGVVIQAEYVPEVFHEALRRLPPELLLCAFDRSPEGPRVLPSDAWPVTLTELLGTSVPEGAIEQAHIRGLTRATITAAPGGQAKWWPD